MIEEVRMSTATITSKGQITIPKEVRDALGLDTGHRVAFLLREDGVAEMRPENMDLMSLCGVLKPSVKGVTVEDMKEAVRQGGAGE
jgi:AbrB family looped-hinge helix DNA binding protein